LKALLEIVNRMPSITGLQTNRFEWCYTDAVLLREL